ncbi:P-loop containing nucleoside triphosphate hydrolase protein [Haematococcus lacustris]
MRDVANAMESRRRSLWQELLVQAIALGGLALSMRMAMKYLDPYREQRDQASKRIKFLRKMLGKQLDLNEYEQLLAVNVVNPAHIDESIDDISGLDDLIQELEMKVLMPMVEPELFCTTLFKPARGVLLYGPPGTGKTMLAKALAKHSGCYFLNITASSIMSKWLGDANRLTRAIFTLAEKLQPCIIFIDEVDAMLGKRGSNSEHEASLSLKTEFMQLWDGMESTRGQRIVVMGATNRPGMVDEAVLRRFSIQHEVGLPDPAQRTAILRTYLRRHAREMGSAGGPAVEPALLENRCTGGRGQGPLDQVAARTEGFSGSDLMELCSQAAQRPLAEFVLASRRASAAVPPSTAASTSGRAAGQAGSGGSSSRGLSSTAAPSMRPLQLRDFEAVLSTMRPSTSKAVEYMQRAGAGGLGGLEGNGLVALLDAMMRMSQPPSTPS